MKKFNFIFIWGLIFLFMSCNDKEELVFKVDNPEKYLHATIKIFDISQNSANVRLNFYEPLSYYSSKNLSLFCYDTSTGRSTGKISLIDNTNNEIFEYLLSDLNDETQYEISISGNVRYESGVVCKISFLNGDNIFETEPKNIIYSSPMAGPEGIEKGWSFFDENGNKRTWETKVDADSREWGGIGYAAYNIGSSSTKEFDWLISPPIYLKKGEEYYFSFAEKTDPMKSYESSDLYVYITPSKNPEEIKTYREIIKYELNNQTYSRKDITYIPEVTGYYYFSFLNKSNYNGGLYLTGFEVTD